MYFSDDEDFFERAAEDQEELLPFEGYGRHLPHEELPPEDEMIPETEQTEVGIEDHKSSQPGDEAVEKVEKAEAHIR